MYCLHPLVKLNSDTLRQEYGKSFVSWKWFHQKKYVSELVHNNQVEIYQCNSCLPCLNMKRYHWVKKAILESERWKFSYFITLTYSNDFVPNELVKWDGQKFVKYLRKLIKPFDLRYILAGEYGGKTGRPHFHLILFTNYEFELIHPRHNHKMSGVIYECELISKAWLNKGFISISFDLDYQSFPYVVSYSNKGFVKQRQNYEKKVFDKFINDVYMDPQLSGWEKYMLFDLNFKHYKQAEFMTFSRKPPLGSYANNVNDSPSSLLKWLFNQRIKIDPKDVDNEYARELLKRHKDFYEFMNRNDLYNIIRTNEIKKESLENKNRKQFNDVI